MRLLTRLTSKYRARAVALAATAAVGLAATGCTPQEVRGWVQWHNQDPAAAEAFAHRPEVQRSLHPAAPVVLRGGNGWTAGNCASFAEEAAAAGLPWGIFSRIAQRETGCDPNAWVVDSDDTGGALFGLNFKGTLATHWRNLCGATTSNIRGNVPLQMRCAAAQYHRYGMGAWSTR